MASSLIFFGYDLATIDWYFVLYVLVSITTVAMGTAKLYTMGVPTAIIYAIGATMVLIFYGYRWFDKKTNKTSTWPPTINTCPDYLTYVKSLPGTNLPGCVDMLGVSKNGTLKKIISTDLNGATALAADRTFLHTSKSIIETTNPAVIKGICQQCDAKGLTWEGVFDGDSCIGVSTNAAAAANKGSCK